MELLVVAVLVALSATIVTVHLGGATRSARLRSATVEIEQALRLARHRARTRHEPVWLEFQVGSGRYRLVFAEHRGTADSVWRALAGVTVERASTGTAQQLTLPGERLAIRLTPTGATLPWALELRVRSARRVVWTDGVTGRLAHQDDVSLADFQWSPAAMSTWP